MYSCDSSCKVQVFQTTLTGHVSIYKVFHKFFVSVASSPSFGPLIKNTCRLRSNKNKIMTVADPRGKPEGRGNGGGGSSPPFRPYIVF